MNDVVEIIVIGAGPAGMSAAQMAAEHGAKTLLLDEQRSPGGQIYRAIEANMQRDRPELGDAYRKGEKLARAFRNCSVDYVPGASVWQLSQDGTVGYAKDGTAHIITADQIILASGALERPVPIPGWTLPGVMTVGAAQILLKESQIGIRDAVFVGTGPLLYLLAHQYITAGIPIKAVIDLMPTSNYLAALAHLPRALPSLAKIIEGWRWKREIASSGIPLVTGCGGVRILGEGRAEAIAYHHDNVWHEVPCHQVLLHQGVAPDVNTALAAGCRYHWSKAQACWNIDVDAWFQSSVPGIAVAGDAAYIAGAVAAEQSGRIAALGALERLGKVSRSDRDGLAAPSQAALKSEMRLRPFLDSLFKPADVFRIPSQPDTVVCRCEEISVQQIHAAVELGCIGPNQLKSYTRCGMGPCQGRFCGLTVSELIGKFCGKPVDSVGYYRLRYPVKPLLLEELANMEFPTKD